MKRLILLLFGLLLTSSPVLAQTSPINIGQRPNVVYSIAQAHVPFVLPGGSSTAQFTVAQGAATPDGNHAAALTNLTALQTTFASGAYFYMPASAITAGSAAGWYYGIGTSTTAVTLYSNSYTSGTPTIPAALTGFATITPGNVSQTTGSAITAYSVTIPANTLGAQDELSLESMWSNNSTAGTKSIALQIGASAIMSLSATTGISIFDDRTLANMGVQTAQVGYAAAVFSTHGSITSPLSYFTLDFTSAQTLTATLQLATASDWLALNNLDVTKTRGIP